MNNNIKYIIEKAQSQNFNVTEYDDDTHDIIDIGTIDNIIETPKTKAQLKRLIEKRIKVNPENPDLSDIDTRFISDMSELFHHQFHIKKLDLSNWDVSNVKNMSDMFNYCSSLEELNLSGWDTSNVTDMNSMFMDCSSLVNLDVSFFNTTNVTDFSYMFQECNSLKKLNLSGWDTSNAKYMCFMFCDCTKLTIDLSNFKTNALNDDGAGTNCMCYDVKKVTLPNCLVNRVFNQFQ